MGATGNNIFERVFIAYGCCIEGFLTGGRHISYMDGTHLSGPYNGTLLSASAYDADNELLPFAIAIVKRETYEDWSWFLHVKENFSAELVKANRGKRKTSKSMKEDGLQLLDNIAYARLNGEFDKAMDHMHCFSPQLFQWLNTHGDVEKWALSKFPYRPWDNITTNLAESFNTWLIKERRHNVTQFIHKHREKVAKKMYAASVTMGRWRNGIGPNIDEHVKKNVALAEHMLPEPYGGGRVVVHTSHGALRVDLGAYTCSCAAWQMSRIPCPHACIAIKSMHGNVYDFVENYYKITSQEKIYSRCMIPVVPIDRPDPNTILMENISEQIFLFPPQTSRPAGRPRANRRESQF
ncbi:uncharacterized protein LOC114746947 [Neltuma alba]|uniref:uncharacterized protein LOC114746947 n=1 Tax=Neltuma alba TaxID=207710 RepID=UPI0010A363C1|nr:uncharacterized protein LOC114746947 [Prosopis alba]